MIRRFARLGVALLVVAFATAPGFAQSSNGTLTGKVTDEQGLALPGVSVTATNQATGFQRSAQTDATGVYAINGLPVGRYEVKSNLTGFSAQTAKNVQVAPSAAASVAISSTRKIMMRAAASSRLMTRPGYGRSTRRASCR